MTKSLTVNQKVYLPSTELARNFDYTADYISKLARDEKVLGTRVGQQWFIEPESLRTYIQQLEVEKKLKKEELSHQRKLELAKHAQDQTRLVSVTSSESAVRAAAKAVVVVVCGFLLGTMGYSVYSEELGGAELLAGVGHVLNDISGPVENGFKLLLAETGLTEWGIAQVVQTSVFVTVPEETEETFAVGPTFEREGRYTVFPAVTLSAPTTTPEMAQQYSGIEGLFSDEVEVLETEEGVFVRPLFPDGSVGELYELSAIPVEQFNDVIQ